MAAPIGKGDWVEALGRPGAISHGFRAGGVYEVEEIVFTAPCSCGGDHGGLHLVGMKRHPHGWRGCQFRPIYRPKADFIESLKAPPIKAPARVSEDA